MPETDCVAFLQWALPRLGRRWSGYRKVRRQVCRRARRRAAELGLDGLAAYREHLEHHPDEWRRLDALAHITISRFYRDRGVFEALHTDVLPALADRARRDGRDVVRAWSAGCASGEEPYTLAIIWQLAVAASTAGVRLEVLGTDVDPVMLRRARAATYPAGAVRELPADWRGAAFDRREDELTVRPQFRRLVELAPRDVRADPPRGPFDLVLCRYLAFTYFDEVGQRDVLGRIMRVTLPGSALVIGTHETLPDGGVGFTPWVTHRGVFRRSGGDASHRP